MIPSISGPLSPPGSGPSFSSDQGLIDSVSGIAFGYVIPAHSDLAKTEQLAYHVNGVERSSAKAPGPSAAKRQRGTRTWG